MNSLQTQTHIYLYAKVQSHLNFSLYLSNTTRRRFMCHAVSSWIDRHLLFCDTET